MVVVLPCRRPSSGRAHLMGLLRHRGRRVRKPTGDTGLLLVTGRDRLLQDPLLATYCHRFGMPKKWVAGWFWVGGSLDVFPVSFLHIHNLSAPVSCTFKPSVCFVVVVVVAAAVVAIQPSSQGSQLPDALALESRGSEMTSSLRSPSTRPLASSLPGSRVEFFFFLAVDVCSFFQSPHWRHACVSWWNPLSHSLRRRYLASLELGPLDR